MGGEDGDDDRDPRYNRAVGARLRSIRHEKRLTQHDVERLSGAQFKASVLGAYERGERALSLPRLERLAAFYEVPVQETLPSIELLAVERHIAELSGAAIVFDLTALGESDTEDLEAVRRFVAMIQVQRQDFNGRVLSVRRADQHTFAAMLDIPPDVVLERLESSKLIFCAD